MFYQGLSLQYLFANFRQFSNISNTCIQDKNWFLLGKLLIFNPCFVCVGADTMMVPPVLTLPPPVAPVRTAGGKALFENLYIPPLPPGVKPLNSFASVHSSMHNITAIEDSSAASGRYVE